MLKDENWALNAYTSTPQSNKGCFYLILCWLISFAIHFIATGIICVFVVWGLHALGIYTIGTWVVALSWKLVLIATFAIMLFKFLFG